MDTQSETGGRRSDEAKAAIVAEAFAAGGSVTAAARRHGISPASIYGWRRQTRERGDGPDHANGADDGAAHGGAFVPVRIESARVEPCSSRVGAAGSRIEIVLGNGRTIRTDAGIEPSTLTRLVAALDAP